MTIKCLEFKEPLNYSQPNITDEDINAVNDVLRSGWIAGNGPTSYRFSEELKNYTGYKHAILVNSATTGLCLACEALSYLNIPSLSNQITVPNLTFIATINALISIYSSDTPGIDIVDVNKNTLIAGSADIGVSFAGYPTKGHILCDDAHGIRPDMTGNLISVVSTHALKQLNTGEGGVVLTDDDEIAEFVTQMTDQGRTSRSRFGYGFNYRMSEINAALGLSQIRRAKADLYHRRYLAREYYNRLNQYSDIIRLPATHPDHAWHLFVVRFLTSEDRDLVRKELQEYNVFTQVHYPPLTSYQHISSDDYLDLVDEYPVSYDAHKTGLSLPLHNGMSDVDVHDVCDILEVIIDGNL